MPHTDPAPRGAQLFRHPGPPLYSQLADILRQRIENGELTPGVKLPSLYVLAEQHDVARVTARQAVQLLVSEGYLESRQGRGTHVAHQLPTRDYENMRTSWKAMVKRIEGASVELLEAEDVSSCPLIGNGEGQPAPSYHYMKRVHIKNDIRFAYIDIYLDKRIFDLAPQRFNETTVIPVMGELGIVVAKARQILTIEAASVEVARQLRLTAGAPVALIRRTAQDPSGCVIYAATVYHPGSRVRFDIDLVG